MRLNDINAPIEDTILSENIKDYHDYLIKRIDIIETLVDGGRPAREVQKTIDDFIQENKDHYLVLRTAVALDKYVSNDGKDDMPTASHIHGLMKSSNVEEVRRELNSFYERVVMENPKIGRTHEHFRKALDRSVVRNEKFANLGMVTDMKFMLEIMDRDIDALVKKHDESLSIVVASQPQQVEGFRETEAGTELTSIVEGMIKSGYFDDYLVEGKENKNDEDEYYMIVDMKLYDNKVSGTTPQRNFKNTLVARGKSHTDAKKKLKSNANRSLKELNKYLKTKNEDTELEVKFSKNDWMDYHTLHKGRDRIQQKNIKGLTGTDLVSAGVMYLKGLDKSGNVSEHPECCPCKYAKVNSKSSIGRYLNKNFPKPQE